VAVPPEEDAEISADALLGISANGSLDISAGGGRVGDSDLENLLSHRIGVLWKLMGREASRYLTRQYELTVAEWWMLAQLAQRSPRTLRWLADATFTDKAQMSRAAADLVKRGLVERQPDPGDARSVFFTITDSGREVSESSSLARHEINRRLLGSLSDEECAILYSSLDRLTAVMLDEEP
jgi:DNA-binding MarR family transcriptional regulator